MNINAQSLFYRLECNEECKAIERNRRMAIGLQIRNPDLSQKLTPCYSEFMRGWAKKDPAFCQHVHEKLTELVKLAKEVMSLNVAVSPCSQLVFLCCY